MVLQLQEHLESNGILGRFQSRFWPFFGVKTMLVRVMNDSLLILNQGQQTILVMLDILVAVDTVDHRLLLQ